MGIRPQTLYKIEKFTENPKIETIPKIAKAFNTTTELLMSELGIVSNKTSRVSSLAELVEIEAEKVPPAERDRYFAAVMGSARGIASAMAAA